MNPHAVITSSRLGFHTTYNTEAVGCQDCAGKRERLARFSFGSGEAAGLLRLLDVVRLGDEHLGATVRSPPHFGSRARSTSDLRPHLATLGLHPSAAGGRAP